MAIKINRAFVFTFLAIVLCCFGCKKSSSTGSNKVKTQTTTPASGTPVVVAYTYDSMGRLSLSLSNAAATSYTYSSATVSKNTTIGSANIIDIYHLNTSGLATSDVGDIYAYSNNYLSKSYTITGSDTITYTIANGNVMSAVESVYADSVSSVITTTHSYYSNTDNRDFGQSFLGAQSTNLVQTDSITQLISGAVYTIVYSYTYTYDSQGRVTQQVRSSGTDTYTVSYTYY